MKYARKLIVIAIALALSGCALLPEIRLFQTKVPDLGTKPAVELETERQAAAYIVTRTTPPIPADAAPLVISDVHAVAYGLSASLGAPAEAVTVDDRDAIIAAQAKALGAAQARADKWQAFSRKHAGVELEGTGFDLMPFLGTGGFIAMIALIVCFPVVGLVLMRIIRAGWWGIKAFRDLAAKVPEAAAEIMTEQSKAMDRADKRALKLVKLTIPPLK
jgi:hypothetical protein